MDLLALKEEINGIGEKIKTLKSSSPPNKEAIDAAVKDLLAKKTLFAENNNGIGVDGQPFEAPMTKAQKKAKAKAEKEGGPAKPVSLCC